MNQAPVILDQNEVQVAKLLAENVSVEKIAEQLNMDISGVMEYISRPALQRYKESYQSQLEYELNIKRLGKGRDILDKVLKGTQFILDNVEPQDWRMKDVKLFEMLLREIPKVQNQINALMVMQPQGEGYHTNKETDELEKILRTLPAHKILLFWDKVREIAREMSAEQIIDVSITK